MRSTRHAPLLLHNTMRITEGHVAEFRAAVERAVAFVEEHGPQLAVQVFVDEEHLLAHSFQLYPDSAAIVRHWELSDPYIADVMEHCEVERLAMYGEPEQDVVGDFRPDVLVPRLIGFVRET
ncbi:hypothetical protein PHK61_12740 [Actinomycetospora lutea]|uniref:hypothetical protein n=1 Tax=Actinomycetospora lutea TaxID=663604 RepID=UPI002365C685|nr:hypothetical protein [Actinomycetospora lutea]MDD7939283.1 hypothetical protein [Actinomycetospora lutea]